MAVKKNYDKYNMFASSSNTEEDEKEDNVSVAARIFERRRQALKQDGASSTESGMSPAEIFKKRKEYLKTATQRTPEQTDILRADREEARKLSQKLSVSPNKKLYATPDQQPQNAGSPFAPIRQTPEQKSQVEEYARQLAEKTKQEKQAKQKREQEQQETKRILDKTGFQDGYQFKRYVDLPNEPDFAETIDKAKNNDPSWLERIQFWKNEANPVEDAFREIESMQKGPIWNRQPANKEDILSRTEGMATEHASSLRKYAMLTDNERYTYDYVFEKAGRDAANKYLATLQDKINQRSALDRYERADKSVPNALKIPYNIGKSAEIGAESAIRGIEYLPDAIRGKQKDYSNTESEYYQSLLNGNAGGAERFAYNTASVIGNMAPSIAAGMVSGGAGATAGASGKIGGMVANAISKGTVGIGILSAQTAGQTYRQDIMEGRPVEGAQINAALTAADEYVTNWLLGGIAAYGGGAVGKVLKNSKVGQAAKQGISNALARNPTVRRAVLGIANYGGDMLSEGTQEAVQDLTESIRKSAIYGDKLDLVGDLTDPQTWEDFALGAVTAGILNAPGTIANNVAINQYGKSLNPDYRDYSQNMDISPEGYTFPEDYQEAVNLHQMAEEYAKRQKRGEFIGNREKAEYDLRFQELQNNILKHNNSNSAKIENTSAQNEPQKLETVRTEEYQEKPFKTQYGPYNEPEAMQIEEKATTESAYLPEKSNVNMAEAYRTPYGENGGKALEENYDGSVDISTYNRAFGRVYDAGRYDIDLSVAEHSAIVSVLTPEQVTAAYKAGAQDRNKEMQIDLKTGLPTSMIQGEAKTGGLGAVTENASEAQRTVAEHIGKMTGLKINLVDDVGEGNATASYKPGEITLSVNASDFNGALSHELTHFIKDYANDAYNVYAKYAVQALMESDTVSLEDLVEQYELAYSKAGQEVSREEIMDEIVSDATQRFFNDVQFAESIAQNDISLAQKIVDFFTDVVDALKSLIKTGSTRGAAKALEEKTEYFEGCRDIWMNAAGEASERYKSGAEIANQEHRPDKNALEKPEKVTETHIDENYKKVKNMEPVAELSGKEFPRGEKKLSEQVLDFFDSIGGKVHNDIIGEILLDKRAIKDDLAHGITDLKAIAFASVPDVLRKGEVLDHQVNWKSRGYDSATVGAKVKIGGEEYYELAVVKLKDKNRLYLHSVYTTKVGENAVLDQVFPSVAESTSGGHSLPINSIIKKLNNVNEATTKKGVKYQLEDIDDTTTKKRIDALLYENQALKEANELLEKQFKISPKSAIRQQDVAKVSRSLLKEYNSTYKQETLEKNLDRLYGYIRGAEHVDSAELTEAATSIARSVLKQSKQVDTELTQQYKDLRNQIRNTKINITDQDKADLAVAGGYNEFRRRNFGRMKLGNDGISIDSLYQELSAQHPELFSNEITHPADQLMAIADVLDQTDAQVSNPYHANMDEMAYMVGQDILQSYFDVRQAQPTFADRKAAEVQRVQREYSRKMADYKKSLKQQYISKLEQVRKENGQKIQELSKAYRNLTAAQQREQAEFYREKMDALRNEKNQALAAAQQRSREQTRMIQESQRAREAKKSIMKETKAMQSWLLKPTDSKHVPEVLRTTVARFLENIDFSSNELNNDGIPTQRSQAWDDAQKAFRNIIDNGGICEDGESFIDIDPDLAVRMEELVNKTRGIDKLDNLDAYSLEELKKVVVSMKKAITEANSLKSNKKSGQLSILAEGVFKDLGDRRNRQEYAMLVGGADKLLNYDMLDPQTMFGQMGDNVKSTYDSLRDGLNRKTVKLKIAQNYIEDLLKENNVSFKALREWTGKEAKPKRFKTSSGTIDLTVSEVMSLYELNKRNQARGHIYDRNGGIKHAPRISKPHFENGKLIPSIIDKNYAPLKVSEADVELIINTLTPEQKALADGMQRFMGNECAEWGNEVTMEMYGYQKFTAGNYFPIVTDGNYIQTKQGDMTKKKSTIKNMGITKNTIKNANNPIIIEDIFDVYTRQVDHMSTYNAYVIPLSDLNKVFNYKDMRNEANGSSIKQEIERTYGKAGNEYIDKLLDDINGSIYTEKSIGDKLLSNMKAASVAGNLRVAIQQPTAYVRASMEISPKYLSRGALTVTRKGQWDLICEYAPIAQWKDWGFYRMDTSRQMKDIMFNTDTMKQRFVNKTMILAEKGDELAWNRLWKACEFECMDMRPELKEGTPEFYTEVGRRFSEIVDKTQVVDSVLHRTQIMRSNHALDRLATNFMAEPLKSYNMLYRAAMDVRLNKKGAKSRAVRAGAVFILNGVCTAVAASVVDALRDDDRDKNYWEKYRNSLKDNILDSINIINNIPWGKDVISAGMQGYSPTRADLSGFQDIYYAFSRINKLKEGDSKYTPQSVAIYSARMASKLLGLPVNSMVRDAEAIVDTVINESGNDSADYKWLKQRYAIGSKENLGLYAGMMIEAYRNDDNEFQKQIKEDLNAAGIDNDTISQKIKTLIKSELISDKSVDPRIDEAAKAKMSMDLNTYEASINNLIEDGYAGKLIGSAITARINQLNGDDEIDWEAEAEVEPDELYGEILTGKTEEEDEWNIYSSRDILAAVEQIDNTVKSMDAFKTITAKIIESKTKAGKTKAEAISTIKSSITRTYKELWIAAYQSGDRKGYEAIQAKLNTLRLDGKNLYSGTDYSSWRKAAKEKEKEENTK